MSLVDYSQSQYDEDPITSLRSGLGDQPLNSNTQQNRFPEAQRELMNQYQQPMGGNYDEGMAFDESYQQQNQYNYNNQTSQQNDTSSASILDGLGEATKVINAQNTIGGLSGIQGSPGGIEESKDESLDSSTGKLSTKDQMIAAVSKKLLSDSSVLTQMKGEFSIIKNYGGEDNASLFSVNNPHKPKGADYYVYTINGQDQEGQFEVFRRYKEFNLFRNVLVARYPGLYIPPIPQKKAMNNTDKDIIEERCHLLNMFIKQVCRCPYLLESEELKLFIRPHIDLEKALTLLPKLTYQQNLERMTKYFSFMGEITESKIQKVNNQINNFAGQARKMYIFLEKFRETVLKLEQCYDAQWLYHKQLNDYFYHYEETNLKTYAGTKYDNFMLFKHPSKSDAKDQLENLPTQINNPFKIMKLWIRWEMLDLSAMLEAIEIKAALEMKKFKRIQKREDQQKTLEKLNHGKNTVGTIFMSKDGKVNKITALTHSISQAEREIECFDMYLKILILQINQAAIPYFKKDKISIYNDLINTYSQQHINNSVQVNACYAKIMAANKEFLDERPDDGTVTSIHQLE